MAKGQQVSTRLWRFIAQFLLKSYDVRDLARQGDIFCMLYWEMSCNVVKCYRKFICWPSKMKSFRPGAWFSNWQKFTLVFFCWLIAWWPDQKVNDFSGREQNRSSDSLKRWLIVVTLYPLLYRKRRKISGKGLSQYKLQSCACLVYFDEFD